MIIHADGEASDSGVKIWSNYDITERTTRRVWETRRKDALKRKTTASSNPSKDCQQFITVETFPIVEKPLSVAREQRIVLIEIPIAKAEKTLTT